MECCAPTDCPPTTGTIPTSTGLSAPARSEMSRSQQSDVGSFVVQNLSGDTLYRSMNKIITCERLRGARSLYSREWVLDAQSG